MCRVRDSRTRHISFHPQLHLSLGGSNEAQQVQRRPARARRARARRRRRRVRPRRTHPPAPGRRDRRILAHLQPADFGHPGRPRGGPDHGHHNDEAWPQAAGMAGAPGSTPDTSASPSPAPARRILATPPSPSRTRAGALTGHVRRNVSPSRAKEPCDAAAEARRSDKERGATGVLVAVMMLVLIGAGAMAVDVGQIYAERAQLQNAADAGAMAAAQQCHSTPAALLGTGHRLGRRNSPARNSNDGATTVDSVDLSVAQPGHGSHLHPQRHQRRGFLTKMFASALNAPPVTVGATRHGRHGADRRRHRLPAGNFGLPVRPLRRQRTPATSR